MENIEIKKEELQNYLNAYIRFDDAIKFLEDIPFKQNNPSLKEKIIALKIWVNFHVIEPYNNIAYELDNENNDYLPLYDFTKGDKP